MLVDEGGTVALSNDVLAVVDPDTADADVVFTAVSYTHLTLPTKA